MTVVAGTSARIESLRRTGSPLELAMRARLRDGQVATTDVVVMEVLAGATDAAPVAGIDRALQARAYIPQRRLIDAVGTAEVYRCRRRAGETPRQTTDCRVAAVALPKQGAVLQRDPDYAVIARHTEPEVVTS